MESTILCLIAMWFGSANILSGDVEKLGDAIRQGDFPAVEKMLNRDPRIVGSNLEGGRPLHLAASLGQSEIVATLLAHGADFGVTDSRGNTALHHAAGGGHLSTVALLLEKGVPVDILGRHGDSPLFVAVYRGHLDIVRLLVKKGAYVNFKNEFEDAPFHYAVYGRQNETIELLKQLGADIDVKNGDGRTPLHLAASEDLAPVAKALLLDKANVVAKDGQGLTPLHLSAFAGNRDIAAMLVDHGADANARATALDTPLHGAAYGGHQSVVEFLLTKGADSNAKNDKGFSPLDNAQKRGHDTVAEVLKSGGARAFVDSGGQTFAAMQHAVSDAQELPSYDFTILYDNYVFSDGTQADWGFSCLIEAKNHTILFDTGMHEAILAANVETLSVDIGKIDQIVISHEHGDHTGGLFWVLEQTADVTVFLPFSMPYDFVRRVESTGATVVAREEPMEIAPNFFLTGEMGTDIKEQSLIFNRIGDLVVVTGCSHPGIVNIVEKAEELRGKKVELVFGGFHIMGHSDEQLANIVEEFGNLGVHRCGASHCTGDHAIDYFRQAFGENFVTLGTGKKLHFSP